MQYWAEVINLDGLATIRVRDGYGYLVGSGYFRTVEALAHEVDLALVEVGRIAASPWVFEVARVWPIQGRL